MIREIQDFESLWDAIVAHEGKVFHTEKGLIFRYRVKGREIFVDRKEKSITESSVRISYEKALEMGGVVKGPKKLGVFGASYIYPIFIALGVIVKNDMNRKID